MANSLLLIFFVTDYHQNYFTLYTAQQHFISNCACFENRVRFISNIVKYPIFLTSCTLCLNCGKYLAPFLFPLQPNYTQTLLYMLCLTSINAIFVVINACFLHFPWGVFATQLPALAFPCTHKEGQGAPITEPHLQICYCKWQT